jgi:hypothetical protein
MRVIRRIGSKVAGPANHRTGWRRRRWLAGVLTALVLVASGVAAQSVPAHATQDPYYCPSSATCVWGVGWTAGTYHPPDVPCLDGGTICDSVGCPGGAFCAWAQPYMGSQGCWLWINQPAWVNWGQFSGEYCGSAGTWSWDNNSSYRTWREESNPPDSTNHCISPYPFGINQVVTPESLRTLAWIQFTSNTANCP